MLAKFAVKNYRGFKEKIELDLSHPANYEFNDFAIKNGIVKNGIVYGPNGCGKTNLGLAIFDIVNHLSQKMRHPDYYSKNFVYAGAPNYFVDFEYTFKFSSIELFYCYSKDTKGELRKESLSVNGIELFRRAESKLSIDSKTFPIANDMKRQLEINVSNVSILGFILMYVPIDDKDSYLIKLKQFVDSMLWFRSLRQNEFIGLETTPTQLEEFVISNNYIKDFQDYLEKVSGQKYHFVNQSNKDKQLVCEIDGHIALFSVVMSLGTEALLLLFYWTKKLDSASFVFIDEFDAFYHFKLSTEVCRLLFQSNCQLFLSSHNTYLMANTLLRPDCNFIITDNKIKPLNECTDKDLRFGHNIEKLYRGNIFAV
ncbi:MAG: AAA family ATPase [Salinivirgaceae bacterium]|nr:AAA family ATPase [Salinivirgaceae bacterium]